MPVAYSMLNVNDLFRSCYWIALCLLVGCANTTAPIHGKSVPENPGAQSLGQLAKADIDRMADVQMRENTESLRMLMIKLYKRNPQELKKSTSGTLDEMVGWVFEGDHHWKFKAINELQGTDAIQLAFKADYSGDRVLPLVVGLQTMLIKAHGDKTEFYYTDVVDPQKVYNASRNIEIAAWKLSTARDEHGQLYLLTNEINGNERNLSFEREFGKMIGRLDLFAVTLSEKSQRFISKTLQNIATAIFLPI